MEISEVRNSFIGTERQKDINTLSELLNKNGNCLMNGYLGEKQINYSFDQEGNLEFNTQINSGVAFINSTGVVYNDNVVIKQSERKDGISSYQLISWSVKNNNYDYIVFDNSVSLDNCYQKIKSLKVDLSNEDIYNKFLELEISFDNVALVLLKQKVDSLSVMLNDKESSISNKSFFNL